MSSTKHFISLLSTNTLYLSLISAIGLALCLYTLYVELRLETDSSYRALCDINQSMSCSAVFASKYGKGFGVLSSPLDIPNPVFGAVFYLIQMLIANVSNANTYLVGLYIINAMASNLGSIYLAFIMAFILRNVCLVCLATYVVNFFMLLLAINRYKIISNFQRKKKD